MFPDVQARGHKAGDKGGDPAGGGGEADALQAVDDEHGDNGRGQYAAQIEDDAGRVVTVVKKQERQRTGQEGDCGHDQNGQRGLAGGEGGCGHAASAPFTAE